MKAAYIFLISDLICFLIILTMDSKADFCQSSVGNLSSYGVDFYVPFPEVNLTLSSSFEYRVYVTNPNNFSIAVTVRVTGEAWNDLKIWSIGMKNSDYVFYNSSFMMKGEGRFNQVIHLSSSMAFGVHVITTEKMDGYTSLPVESWGNHYLAVTYCKPGIAKCQLVLMASQYTEIRLTLMAQDSNTISVMDTQSPAAAEDLTINLEPGQVYQVQRLYDITGAVIHANVSVGVLSGSAGTPVGGSPVPGAFLEFLSPVRTYGTEFVLYQTYRHTSASDLVLILAFQDSTVVYMSTGQQRFSMSRLQHLKRYFTDALVYIRSDRPVSVVKFTQGDQSVTPPQYPTMSIILPTTQYLANVSFILSKMPNITRSVQYMVIIGRTTAMNCLAGPTALDTSYITELDIQANVYNLTSLSSALEVACPSYTTNTYGVYLMMSSDYVSYEVPVAYGLDPINGPCSISTNSPGDVTDNDCDFEIDEDPCDETNFWSYSDCGPIITGDRSVYGKNFTFLLPEDSDNDTVNLHVSNPSGQVVNIVVTTPKNLSLVNQSYSSGELYSNISLPVGVLAGALSTIYTDRTIHVHADQKVSITTVVFTSRGNINSAYATRIIPDELLGREYFIVTFCMNSKTCRMDITAFHNDDTSVRIRFKQNAISNVTFNSKAYLNGDTLCVTLTQYQSLQLQSTGDLTGSHIVSSKPVAVWTTSKLTRTFYNNNRDSIAEHLPPVETWGSQFAVKQTPKCPTGFEDIIKIVASTSQTEVTFKVNSTSDNKTLLDNAGSFLEYKLMSDFVTITSTKPVLVVQITQNSLCSDVSISLVTPVSQYLQDTDQVFQAFLYNETDKHVIVTTLFNANTLEINNRGVNMTYFDDLQAGYGILAVTDFFVSVENNMSFPFGGQVYSNSKFATYLYPLAFGMNKVNKVCQVTKSSPGDNVDNDCDGVVDEEPCIATPQDVDKDGMDNEDCALPPETTSLDSVTSIDYDTLASSYSSLAPQASSYDQYITTPFSPIYSELSTNSDATSVAVYSLSELTNPALTTSNTLFWDSTNTAEIYSLDSQTALGSSGTLVTLNTLAMFTSLATSDTLTTSGTLTTSDTLAMSDSLATFNFLATSDTLATPGTLTASDTLATSDLITTFNSLATSDTLTTSGTRPASDTLATSYILAASDTLATSGTLTASGTATSSKLSSSDALFSISTASARTDVSSTSTAILTSTGSNLSAFITSATTSTTATISTTKITSTSHSVGQYCGCQCPVNILTTRPAASEIVEMTSSIQKELEIDKSETSANKRTLTSAPDERRSAQTIGYFGVAIFVTVFAGIVFLDFNYLAKDVIKIIKFIQKGK
ncbi:serine-rich adhesin for platelets-like isoform X1 [Biomphalaria glabrata]|uniref:Serine-rich adhesin for platelets-like isoform X1 n=1 Tax=Biomphalaria glabrata TaxID=6526 RepID=A0A9W3B176_BIOGL|nr:serine-rich adhesin for platelets-like isoform X1 [Biomphalaria glabrata]